MSTSYDVSGAGVARIDYTDVKTVVASGTDGVEERFGVFVQTWHQLILPRWAGNQLRTELEMFSGRFAIRFRMQVEVSAKVTEPLPKLILKRYPLNDPPRGYGPILYPGQKN